MKTIVKKFNMVEIMLAVVIIAVGMASVFVLFPTGLNAHKTAVAENTIADFAEYIISTVKARVKCAAEKDFSQNNKGNPGKEFHKFIDEKSYLGLTVFKASDSGKKFQEALDIESVSGRKNLEGGEAKKEDAFLLDTDGGYILIRQLSGPEDDRYVDFSAVAVIKENPMIKDDFRFWKFSNGSPGSTPEKIDSNADKLKQRFLVSYVLEISYPADRAWEEREKRYFPFELYNNLYEAATESWLSSAGGQP